MKAQNFGEINSGSFYMGSTIGKTSPLGTYGIQLNTDINYGGLVTGYQFFFTADEDFYTDILLRVDFYAKESILNLMGINKYSSRDYLPPVDIFIGGSFGTRYNYSEDYSHWCLGWHLGFVWRFSHFWGFRFETGSSTTMGIILRL